MKKLLLLFAVTLLSLRANAQVVQIDGINYELNSSDKTAKVTSYPYHYLANPDSVDVVIPQSITYDNIAYNVTSIGSDAFTGWSELIKISIPNSITRIEREAFAYCTNLTSVNITDIESWCKISFGNENSNPLAYAHHLYIDGKEVIDLTIPDGIESILPYAFYGCNGLSSVTLSNTVKTVDYKAFGNVFLNRFVVGTGVTQLSNIFNNYDIRPIKTIWLPNTPPDNYDNARGKVNYVANNQYNMLNQKEYKYISSMFEMDGVVYVPVSPSDRTCDAIDCAYDASTVVNIKSVVSNQGIDLKVLNVQPYTFYGNTNLQKASFDITGILSKYVFYNCNNLVTAKLGNNITGIDEYAFSGCSKLDSIIIPDAVSTICQYAFENCSNLTSAVIGNGTFTIEQNVFSGCTALPKVSIPGSVSYIGDYAFRGCNSLKEVVMDNRTEGVYIQSYGDWIYSENKMSKTINVSAGDTLSFDYEVTKGYLRVSQPGGGSRDYKGTGRYNRVCEYTGIVALTCKIDNYTDVPIGGVSNIKLSKSPILLLGSNGEQPLFADSPLDSVYIGRNITYSKNSNSGYSPFYRNTTLRSVMITDKKEEISENEFYGCTNLQNVQIGDGVTTIGDWAFSGCSSLNHFGFGTQVKTIGREAFSDCTAVTKIYSKAATPPACGTQALDDINKWNCTLCVPKGSLASYQATDQWKEFFFMEEGAESSGVTRILANDVQIIADNGEILVSGVNDGTDVVVYSVSGHMVGTSKAKANQASVFTNIQKGEIAIVKIGDKSVKVVMQ